MKNILFYTGLGLLLAVTESYGQGGIRIMPGTTFSLTGGPQYIVLADGAHFENNAIVQTSGLILKAIGTGNSQIKGSAPLTVAEIYLNKSAQNLVLQKDVNVGTSVNFISGLLNLNNNDIILASTASLVGESEASRTIGATGGGVQITQNLNAPLAENPGNLGMVITSAANWGNTLIRRTHQVQTSGNGGTSIERSFEMLPSTNTGLNAFLRMYYFDAELNAINENFLDFVQSNNGGASWNYLGSASRNTIQNFVNINGIQTMSLFTLTATTNPLPITLLSISSDCISNHPHLRWRIANPGDVQVFRIEKSADGNQWQLMDEQVAVQAVPEYEYNFTDQHSSYPYYRLQTVNKKGDVSLSPVQVPACSIALNAFSLLQNPVQHDLMVRMQAAENSTARVTVFDNKGSQVLDEPLMIQQGASVFNHDISGFAPGIYQVRITAQQRELWHAKFIKQ